MTDSAKKIIDFKEEVVNATLTQAHAAYDLACERILKLLPVLVGAASAVAVFGVGIAHKQPTVGAPMIAAAIWWCLVASYAVLRGATSNTVSAGTDVKELEAQFQRHRTFFAGDEALALNQIREDQVSSLHDQAILTSGLASARSTVIDRAYRALVIGTPVVLALGYLIARRWPDLF